MFARVSCRVSVRRHAARFSTIMAAVIERTPVVTPEIPAWQQKEFDLRADYIKLHKVYPKELTDVEEVPDQARARQRVERIIARDGGRLGSGDKKGDERTMDRCLSERLYLLLSINGTWQFPQVQ